MKTRNLSKPEYSSVEDRRGVFPRPPSKEDRLRELISRIPTEISPKKTISQPDDKPNLSRRIMLQAQHSASAALQRMGNQPLPSKRPPKGNNPGSVALMKFPKLTRSK